MLIPQEVHITFFDLRKCGFYKGRDIQPLFGAVDDVLTQLQAWSAGIDLSRTKIFDPAADDDIDPVYLFGLQKQGGSWIVATWNEVPHSESGVASVSMDAKVGAVEVHMNGVVKNSIPGYATYFWIIPGRNLLATVKFSAKSGQPGLVAYLNKFMHRYTKYTVLGDRDGTEAVFGWTNRPDRVVMQGVRPLLQSRIRNRREGTQFFLDRVESIRRVMRRGHLTTATVLEKTMWQNAIRFIGGQPSDAHVVEQRLYVEIDHRPTAAELAQMIEADELAQKRGFDDLGFKFDGDAREYWLSGARAAGTITLNIKRVNDAAVDTESLLQALQHK